MTRVKFLEAFGDVRGGMDVLDGLNEKDATAEAAVNNFTQPIIVDRAFLDVVCSSILVWYSSCFLSAFLTLPFKPGNTLNIVSRCAYIWIHTQFSDDVHVKKATVTFIQNLGEIADKYVISLFTTYILGFS